MIQVLAEFYSYSCDIQVVHTQVHGSMRKPSGAVKKPSGVAPPEKSLARTLFWILI